MSYKENKFKFPKIYHPDIIPINLFSYILFSYVYVYIYIHLYLKYILILNMKIDMS